MPFYVFLGSEVTPDARWNKRLCGRRVRRRTSRAFTPPQKIKPFHSSQFSLKLDQSEKKIQLKSLESDVFSVTFCWISKSMETIKNRENEESRQSLFRVLEAAFSPCSAALWSWVSRLWVGGGGSLTGGWVGEWAALTSRLHPVVKVFGTIPPIF